MYILTAVNTVQCSAQYSFNMYYVYSIMYLTNKHVNCYLRSFIYCINITLKYFERPTLPANELYTKIYHDN